MAEIFVFGSNLAGRHGKGAAKYAASHYGAEYGVGVGPTGQSYALPTKDGKLKVLPPEVIQKHIQDFCEYARGNPKHTFLLTPIGTGLSGYPVRDIRIMFKKAKLPENVYLTSTWVTSC